MISIKAVLDLVASEAKISYKKEKGGLNKIQYIYYKYTLFLIIWH